MNAETMPIVVGVDDSPSSRSALYWAVDEATLRGRPLHVVYAWRSMYPTSPGFPSRVDLAAASRAYGQERLASLLARVQASDPQTSVTGHLLEGRPSAVLLDTVSAVGAQLLVVGARGVGGFDGLLLGSVGLHVVSYAPCPVVVVRVAPRPTGSIVVGIDGSSESKAVLAAAVDEAAARKRQLDVVRVLYVHSAAEGVPDQRLALASATSEAEIAMDSLLADAVSQHPDIEVRTDLVAGYPAEVLINASATASLLVIGSHGGGGFMDMGMGSVAHAVVHHAHCPVMVIREGTVRR